MPGLEQKVKNENCLTENNFFFIYNKCLSVQFHRTNGLMELLFEGFFFIKRKPNEMHLFLFRVGFIQSQLNNKY